MNIKIPFESEIPFKTNISEITKMSLEHDYNVSEYNLLGNFYISGEYKTHEVSINKEEFNFTLPFSVDLREDIDTNSLEFNIEDFTYDVINNNTLKVNIEYSIKGNLEERELFQKINEEELNSELEFIDNFLENEEEKEVEEKKEDKKEESIYINDIVDKNDRINQEEEKTIMETIKNSDDTFVTYHIHIVKENETIESICNIYNVSTSLVNEYNNTDNISMGDKILIPKVDE